MKFSWNAVRFVFRGLGEFQDALLPYLGQWGSAKRLQFGAELLCRTETLRNGRVKGKEWSNYINGNRRRRGIMGLWMKQERVPAVVRVLRLIASSADCLGHYQICRVIYGSGAPGDLQALRDHMMAIVRLPATPERSTALTISGRDGVEGAFLLISRCDQGNRTRSRLVAEGGWNRSDK